MTDETTATVEMIDGAARMNDTCQSSCSQCATLQQAVREAEEIIMHYRKTVPLDYQTYWVVDKVHVWLIANAEKEKSKWR